MSSTTQPVFFGSAFESLYLQALGDRSTPGLQKDMRALGLDLSKPLLPAYPFEVWYGALLLTATTLNPTVSREEAVERMGRLFLAGFQRTLLGGAVLQLARVIGVERSLVRMDRNARTSSNVFVSSVEKLGVRHVKMSSQLDPEFVGRFPPGEIALVHFQTGVARAFFELMSIPSPLIQTRLLDAPRRHGEIEIKW